jgi:DNA-binding protein Alba
LSKSNKTPTEAEEIFSEFQKSKESTQESLEVSEPQVEPTPEPEPSVQEAETQPLQQEEAENEEISVETPAKTESSASSERNVIFVGLKPLMTYVTATLTQLAIQPTVTIKARGRRITQAVDVSQMIVKRMNAMGYTITDVRIASDSLTSQDGKLRNVSTIEIDVSKS